MAYENLLHNAALASPAPASTALHQIIADTLHGTPLCAGQALHLSTLLPHALLDIMAAARLQASRHAGKAFTCGIINAKSGNCTEDCAFCAQSHHYMTSAPVHPRVSFDALQARAEELSRAKAGHMGIVISGKSPSQADLDYFCDAIARLSDNYDIKFCASFGIIRRDQALALRQAGFSGYHHNLESSRGFFPSVCTSHSYDARIETIKNAQTAGLRVCSGGIFGMGESWEQRIELMFTLKELHVDSVPMNFLTAIKGTPLENVPAMPAQHALALVALMRLVYPTADIIVCGGRKAILNEWEKLIFPAGANGLMIENYLTTTGSALNNDQEMLQTLGIHYTARC